jgi:hypothetical protein
MHISSRRKLLRSPSRGFGWSLLLLTALFLVRLVLDWRLAASGVIAHGKVVNVETGTRCGCHGTSRRQRGTGKTVYATVRFAPAGGALRDFKTICTFREIPKKGDAVKVIHLPWNPAAAEIYSVRQLWLPLAVGFAVTLISGGAGVFLLRCARRAKPAKGAGIPNVF